MPHCPLYDASLIIQEWNVNIFIDVIICITVVMLYLDCGVKLLKKEMVGRGGYNVAIMNHCDTREGGAHVRRGEDGRNLPACLTYQVLLSCVEFSPHYY